MMLNGNLHFVQPFHQEAIQLFRGAFAVNPSLQQVLQHVANAERAVAKQPGGVLRVQGGLRWGWECWVWSFKWYLCLGLLIQVGSWDDNGRYLQSDTKVDCNIHIILRIIRQEKPVIARLQQASRVLSTAQLFEKEWLAETLVYGIHNMGIHNSAEVHTYCPFLAKIYQAGKFPEAQLSIVGKVMLGSDFYEKCVVNLMSYY